MWRILRYKIGEEIGVLILVTIDLSNWRKIQMIRVIATVKLKKGKRQDYLKQIYKVMPMVHIESGCIEYAPYVDADSGFPAQKKLGPDTVAIIERWQSLNALKKHSTAPHMNSFRKATQEIIESVDLLILTPVH